MRIADLARGHRIKRAIWMCGKHYFRWQTSPYSSFLFLSEKAVRRKRKESNMPKNRVQGTVFGILMSYVMAYGMEIYNVGVKYGVNLQRGGFSNMPGHIFLDALTEASYMGIFVIILSTLYGNKAGAAFAAK